MLTTRDIKSLTKYLIEVFREEFATKQDIADLKRSFFNLQTSVDGIAKDNLKTNQEILALHNRAEKVETWIGQAGTKIGIEFKQ
jgi:hypothetical protein